MKLLRFISQQEYDTLIEKGEVTPKDMKMAWSGRNRIHTFPLEDYSKEEYSEIKDYLEDTFRNIEYDYAIIIDYKYYAYKTAGAYDKSMVDLILNKTLNFEIDHTIYSSGPVYVVPEIQLGQYSLEDVIDIKPLSKTVRENKNPKEDTGNGKINMRNKELAVRIINAEPNEFADIILDLDEQGLKEESDLLLDIFSDYIEYSNIVKTNGDKKKRDKLAKSYSTGLKELLNLIYPETETLTASTKHNKGKSLFLRKSKEKE